MCPRTVRLLVAKRMKSKETFPVVQSPASNCAHTLTLASLALLVQLLPSVRMSASDSATLSATTFSLLSFHMFADGPIVSAPPVRAWSEGMLPYLETW